MEEETDDPVYLPSVWFLKHLVLALLETEESGTGKRGRKHSSGKTAFSVVYFKILSWTSSDCSSSESSGFLSSLQVSFSVLKHVKHKNSTRSGSSVVHCSWNNTVQSSSQQSLHLSNNLCLTFTFVNCDCITFTCGFSVPLFVRAH